MTTPHHNHNRNHKENAMNELAQLVALMREMNERLKRIEENTRPKLDHPQPGAMHYPADLDGAHHVAEAK